MAVASLVPSKARRSPRVLGGPRDGYSDAGFLARTKRARSRVGHVKYQAKVPPWNAAGASSAAGNSPAEPTLVDDPKAASTRVTPEECARDFARDAPLGEPPPGSGVNGALGMTIVSTTALANEQGGGDGGAATPPEISPALENVALVADGSSPPDSRVGETLGLGGCVAVALCRLGVFKSLAVAKRALNAQIAVYSAKIRPDYRIPEHTGVLGSHWHPEVVKLAVVHAGFHLRKVKLSAVDLASELERPGEHFLIDGVLNDSFAAVEDDVEARYGTVRRAKTTPRNDEGGWRHAIAVSDGMIREREFSMPSSRLWLDHTNTPDAAKGYMLKVLKVFRIFKCTAPDVGSAECQCKGTCSA